MQQENNQPATKGNINELKSLIKDGFKALDKKTDIIEEKLDRKIAEHDRRLSTVEDRVRVVKNTIEKSLKTKVAW